MSSTTRYSAQLKSILDAAFDSYTEKTGVELVNHPSGDKLQNCSSSEDVLQVLLEGRTAFKSFRDKLPKFLDGILPVVNVALTFSAVLGEAAALVPFPATTAIFVGIDVLLSAVIDVSSSYDALLELFECIASFLKRLHVYTTKIPLSSLMSEIIVKIMVEVLSVLALATKQIKQGRFKKFAKKLLGESEVEDILQRLDRLTQEEAQMTEVHTLAVVHEIFDNMKVVMDDRKASAEGIRNVLASIQQTTDGIKKLERDQLQKDIRNWLSPPDPSINHNTARKDHHDGTASWFIERSSKFKEWKSNGSLLWISGKPGSGKSILCSSIIHEAERLRDTGLALTTYFYFDFKDPKKQQGSGFLASILSQLSAKSNACYEILSALYSKYDAGSRWPGDDALMDCLADMLKVEGQPIIYIIMDAIDECPNEYSNSSGLETPREWVLELVNQLVGLQLENVRICAVSRPEADIRSALEPLASHTVSLHDEDGQKADISFYVESIINTHRNMKRWRPKDKVLVINTLSQKASGMFRWIVCQLKVLMNTLPPAVARALANLPQGLDETYDRILEGISQQSQDFAHRLFACLAASFRPLRVEELADILAIDFDDGEVPNYDQEWRPQDPEEAVSSACSSLIAIVDVNGSRIVQFSHFSVKEYLTSERLKTSEKLSQFHITPRSAHTILAQASLSILLALEDTASEKTMMDYSFATYAARHWVDHARFEDVSIDITDAMKRLFDPAEPHFAAWVWIYDIDYPLRETMSTEHPTPPKAVPLYYATLCGFRGIVGHLIDTYPQDVNATGGLHGTPLHAAIVKGNTDIMMFLLENKGDTALNLARLDGELGAARLLQRYGTSVGAPNTDGWASMNAEPRYEHRDIVRMLLDNGAMVDSRNNDGSTPLMTASRYGHLDIVRMLLDHDATVDSQNNDGWTSLMLASGYGHPEIVGVLLEHGATVDLCNNDGWTPLLASSQYGYPDVVPLLLKHDANMDSRGNDGWSPLIAASRGGYTDIVGMLLEKGVTVETRTVDGWSPLLEASRYGHTDIVRLLLKTNPDLEARNNYGSTPLKLAAFGGHLDNTRLLLEKGGDADTCDNAGWTPLMEAAELGHLKVIRLLIEKGATVDSLHKDRRLLPDGSKPKGKSLCTPVHIAAINGQLAVAEFLIQHKADVNKPNENNETPLIAAARQGHLEIARLLLRSGSDVNSQDCDGSSPLHKAAQNGRVDIVTLLLDSGADVNICNEDGKTSLNVAVDNGRLEVVKCLIERIPPASLKGVDLALLEKQSQASRPNVAPLFPEHKNTPTNFSETGPSLHVASREGKLYLVQSLLDGGAKVNDKNTAHETPIYCASIGGSVEVAKLLIDRGANVNLRDRAGWTPLHVAAALGRLEMVHLLLDHGAEVNARGYCDRTALHLASNAGQIEVVKALLSRKGNAYARNDKGNTPAQEAQRMGKKEIFRLLSDYTDFYQSQNFVD